MATSEDFKSCNANSLLIASKCLIEPCMSQGEREAIDILVRVYELEALGGHDYRSDLAALLNAAKAFRHLSKTQREAMLVYLDWQSAIANGASVETTVAELKKLVSCYMCLGKEDKEGILVYLRCAIDAAAASPR